MPCVSLRGQALSRALKGSEYTEPSRRAAPLRRPNGSPVVSPSLVRRIRVLAEALFATEEGPPPRERLAWVEDNIEDFLSRSGQRSRWVFGALVLLCTVLAPLFVGRLRRLQSLPLSARVEALSRLERHFGEPLLAVKAILCLIYYEHPDAAREVGFEGGRKRSPEGPSVLGSGA